MIREGVQVPIFTPLELMDANRGVAGVNVGHLWHEDDMFADEMRALLALFEAGEVAPRIDAVLPLERAAEAHGRLSGRRNVGEVLLTTQA